MQFVGVTGALTVLVIGALLAAVQNQNGAPWEIFLIGGLALVGLIIAGVYAYLAAQPVPFEMVGSYPSAWAEDLAADKPLKDALQEVADLYDGMLDHNRRAMSSASGALKRAGKWLGATIGVCGVLTLALLVTRWVQALPTV